MSVIYPICNLADHKKITQLQVTKSPHTNLCTTGCFYGQYRIISFIGQNFYQRGGWSHMATQKKLGSSTIQNNWAEWYWRELLSIVIIRVFIFIEILLHVQNSISNWRRKQDNVPIDIQPQKGIPKIIDLSSTLANWWLLLVHT